MSWQSQRQMYNRKQQKLNTIHRKFDKGPTISCEWINKEYPETLRPTVKNRILKTVKSFLKATKKLS